MKAHMTKAAAPAETNAFVRVPGSFRPVLFPELSRKIGTVRPGR